MPRTGSPHFSSGTPITATSATAGWEKRASSTSIDDTFSPPRDDHVLLAVRDRDVALVVERAAVAGVEPAVDDGLGGGVGLLPVALEHVVAASQHLALTVDARAAMPSVGAPARPSFLARSAGSRSSHSARARFIVSSGAVSVRP